MCKSLRRLDIAASSCCVISCHWQGFFANRIWILQSTEAAKSDCAKSWVLSLVIVTFHEMFNSSCYSSAGAYKCLSFYKDVVPICQRRSNSSAVRPRYLALAPPVLIGSMRSFTHVWVMRRENWSPLFSYFGNLLKIGSTINSTNVTFFDFLWAIYRSKLYVIACINYVKLLFWGQDIFHLNSFIKQLRHLLNMEIECIFPGIFLPRELDDTSTETAVRSLWFLITIFCQTLIKSKYKLLWRRVPKSHVLGS